MWQQDQLIAIRGRPPGAHPRSLRRILRAGPASRRPGEPERLGTNGAPTWDVRFEHPYARAPTTLWAVHADETRALRRAGVVLLAVSALRWGWSARGEAPAAVETVLPELLEGSIEATQEGARRRAPLADNERIDPNRADEVDLDRLPGVGPSTARAVVAARDSGMVFRSPEDLLEVRGIGEATLERLRGALDFSHAAPAGRPRPSGVGPAATSPGRAGSARLVDVNTADLQELEELPGVGPALAERILAARKERMFTTLDDLERVPGIGPATVRRLRPHATVGRGR